MYQIIAGVAHKFMARQKQPVSVSCKAKEDNVNKIFSEILSKRRIFPFSDYTIFKEEENSYEKTILENQWTDVVTTLKYIAPKVNIYIFKEEQYDKIISAYEGFEKTMLKPHDHLQIQEVENCFDTLQNSIGKLKNSIPKSRSKLVLIF